MSKSKITPAASTSTENSQFGSKRSLSLLIMAGMIAVGGAIYVRRIVINRPPSQEAIISKSKVGMAVVSELDSLQAKVQSNPNDVKTRIQLVKLYNRLQLIDLAVEQLREIVRIEPGKPDHRLVLGNALMAKGDNRGAEQVFIEIVQKWAQNAEGYQGLSATLFTEKRYAEAMRAAKQAVQLDSNDMNNHFALGAAAFQYAMQFPDPEIHSDELFIAKQEFEAVAKVWTNNGDVFYRLGKVYNELRLRKQAIPALEKAYTLLPDRGDVAFALAALYNSAGSTDKALKICEEAIGRKADHFSLYELAGSLYLNRGTMDNVQKAVAMYQKAVDLRPDTPRTLDKYGVALLKVGKTDEARQAFEKSLLLNPNRAFPYQQMATIYTRMRLPDRAKIAADMARKMTANEQQLKQLQERSKVDADNTTLRLILADRYRDLKMFGAAKDEYFYVLRLDRTNARALEGIKIIEAAMKAEDAPPPPVNSVSSPPTTGGATR